MFCLFGALVSLLAHLSPRKPKGCEHVPQITKQQTERKARKAARKNKTSITV
ncbi:uncharacterized protein LOC119546066 [Drosophila subpulchrella]|uniref:uncharacterized protein LOC119546066 n=1 Tax=Drosophila subpulchrella TaxID=1486046 RepID=UPI0018A15E98|nr:uncharacterized protein LOC119546066 [Drosophila subpulchrella]